MATRKKTAARPILSLDDLDAAGIGLGWQPMVPAQEVAPVAPIEQERDGPMARGVKQVSASVGLAGRLAARDFDGAAKNISDQAAYRAANSGSEEAQGLMRAWQQGDGIWGGIKAVAGEFANDYERADGIGAGVMSVGRNLQAMGSGLVEQVPNMALPVVGMLGGGAAGGAAAGPMGVVAGGWAGASAGNALVGTSEAAFRQLEKAGVDPSDAAAVREYLARHGDAILGETAVKGGVIGAVDVATAGLAHWLLSGPGKLATTKALTEMGVDMADKAAVKAATQTPVFKNLIANDSTYQATKVGAQKLLRNTGAAATEPVGEFAGEYGGSLAATGEADAKDAFLEAASSLGQSGIMFAGQKAIQAIKSPAQAAADTIRATEKVPESGALTKAVNAGVEAKAQAVEAGAPVPTQPGTEQAAEAAPEPVDDPVRDQILALPDGARQDALRAYAVVNRTDVAKGVQQYNRKLLDRLLAENQPAPEAALEVGGIVRNFDPKSQPTNTLSLAPMGEAAYDNGIDFQANAQSELARRNAELDDLTRRAPRTSTAPVDLSLPTDPVQNYLDNLRSVNTPAARAYVRDFDAGRITPADVQQRMQAERGLTPEQRIARAAADAPAQTDPVADRLARAAAQGMATPAPTDILNPAGEPFKTRMAADRAAKKTPGAVVPVEGGFVVRPQEPVNVQDAAQGADVTLTNEGDIPESAPVEALAPVAEQPAGPAAGVPAEGAGAVEAAGLIENKVGRKDSAQIAQPESVVGDTSSPWASMTPDQRRRTRLEQEIATGMTNNGGVMAKLRPSAIEKRKQELAAMPPKEAAGAAPSSGVIPAVPAAPAPTIVEVQDNYGRTHRVRQSDLYSNADRIPTVRQNGDVVAGEEIPRSIVKDAPTIPLAQQGAFDGGRRLEADAGNDTAAAGAVPAQGNPAAGEPAATGAGGEMLDAMDGRPGASAAPAGDVAGPAAPAVGAPLDALQNQAVAPTQQAQAATENVANDTPQPQSAPVGDEQRFAPESGTLGIPRAEMPQVPTQSHGGLVKHLNAQGIEHETTMVDAAESKPTQAEFSPSKVEKAKEATGDRAVIVSSDGHIIDGHHQALAAAEEGKPVKAIVLDAPVEQALEAVKNSPSAQPQVAADVPVAKPINRSDVDAARQQAATAIGARIDAMSAQEVQKIAARFLPTMGVRVPAGKARIKEAVTSAGPRMNWAAAAAEFGAELSQDAMSALQADVEGRVQEGAGPAMPSAVAEISPAPATHADPGHAPEVVTPAVVAQSVQKAARNEAVKPSEMRQWIVGEIDKAMLGAPEKDAAEFVSFDVPGDGTFKVQKSRERLQEFRKKVLASPGFKDGGQKQNTNPPEQVDSARNGSGSTVEALRNFLADGDVQGAVEFAKLKGMEFTPVEPRASMTANGKFKRVPASVKSSVPSVAEGLTQVEAEQINQYLTAESAKKEPAATQDADVQPSPQDFIPAPASASPESESSQGSSKARGQDASAPPTAPAEQPDTPKLTPAEAKEDDAGNVAMFSRRSASGNRLPDVVIGHKLGSLSSHPDYEAAKAGNSMAAARIASDLVDDAMVEAVRRAAGNAELIVPVVSVEATGRNKIPLAVARELADRLGSTAETEIVQADSPKRTSMDGLSRLLNPPVFDGPVMQGAAYVLVDDTVTQGGTFASLASHIRDNGGDVAGVVALTGKQYSAKLEPSSELLQQVRDRFQSVEPAFRSATGYGFDALTESEARYLVKHDDAESVRNRILAAGSERVDGGDRGLPKAFARQQSSAAQADSNARNVATQQLVDGLKAKWTRAPEIIVARNMQDAQIPQEVRDYDALLKSQGATGEPRGFIYKGKVYLLSDQLKGPQQIAEVLFHEALGHYGLRGVFGDGLTPILQQMGTLRRKEVEAKAREYGLFSKDALGGLDKTAASDSQIWDAMSAKDRLSAAEEVLAEMAQTKPELGYVKRAIAAIRNWLRANVPGFKNLKLTDADIVQAYILPARAYVTRSNETVQQAIDRAMADAGFSRTTGDQTQTEAFERWFKDSKVVDADGKPLVVYHGTEADFSVFDPEKIGSANTQTKRGSGFYFAKDPALTSRYANREGANVIPAYVRITNPAPDIDSLSSDEYDGFINSRIVVVKSSTQIKSAIGNQGTFDPANPDIRFSRATDAAKAVGDTLKSITVANVKQRAGFKLTDYLGIGLQALGRRQIVDIYGDLVPLAEYNRLVQQMEADKNEGGAEADQLVTRWAKLDDEGKLADLMHDATLAQIDPAEDFVEGDDKGKYLELQRKFNLLSDGAKKVYADTRDSYKAHHAKVRSAIKERIERSEIKGERKAALLKQMDDEFFKAIKGVYFPLARFGQYAVTVKGPDGKVESVSRAETKAEAEALRNNLLSAFPRDKGFTVGRVMLSKDFIADRDAVGRGFMTELYQVLDKQDMDATQRAELEDTLGQLYLSSLPDLSWAKHGIHRKGTPGFSQDARRAFAQNMFHGARYLAKLRYSDLMQDELAAMQKHVDDWREVEDFDQNSAQRVVDEMNKRHESLMNPKSNALSTALTSLGFVFHLGLSPASAMVNLSQTALVAYPIMGAKWGFGKASAALLKASAEAAKGKNDITGSLNADERAAYDEAVRAGTIDVTMAHDLAGIAQGEDAGVMWKIRPVMRWASFLFHHAERFNRQVTFVAAYRLAREAGADHKAAFEQATKATYDGHFDYGAANRPRIMQGNVAKVLLLFKQYGQNMVYTLARNAQQAIKGESPEVRAQARKALGGLLATHAAAAGVLGLPMVTTLLAAASMIGGDDDEPWDAKVALQNMLADTFGQKPAEVLAHGLSRLTPWDISGRVGLDKLIFPDVQEGLEGQRLWESAATQALGPVGGIFGGVLKGLDLISDGHYKLGLEAMLPAVLRQGVKSIRYATDGVQDKTGVVIKDEVSLAGVAGQFLGFSPSEVRLAQEGKSAIYQHDKALTGRREELLSKAARATRLKDAEARAEAMKEIERFNQKNPTRRITPLNVLQSVRNRQKRIDQAEGGVYLPKNRRDAMEAGRFAVVESE